MSKTSHLTMAQALIRFLDQQYLVVDDKEYKFVEGIFGIFGHGNVTGIGEALEFTTHDLQFIRGNNEQGMAHAAIAFAKQHNRTRIFAVTSSVGPGATNLVTAAATATINRIPVLLLPGDIFSSRGPDPVLQQLEHPCSQDISVNDSLKPVSRYFDRIHRPEQLMSALVKAFAVLTDPALTGAVTLCLPQDVQSESFAYPNHFFRKRVHRMARKLPEQDVIKAAANIIARCERPMIIAGGGVHYSFAANYLEQFAAEFAIPVVETQAGKSALPHDAPTNLGGLGVMGTSAANRIARDADCVIAVGTRLNDFVTSSKTAFKNEQCRIVTINVDPFDSKKLEPALSICADAACTLSSLAAELRLLKFRSSRQYEALFAEEKSHWLRIREDKLKPCEEDVETLNQLQVLGTLNELCDANAVVVAAAGSLPGDLQRFWHAGSYKGYHLEYGYSCMGYEVAGAFGVKMAEPQREVWSVVGDGSFLMMHSEIVTAIQENCKINILLFDSGGFNSIKSLQCAMGSNGYGTDLLHRNQETQKLDADPVRIDFAKYGEALGLATFRAHNLAQLRDHIKQAQLSPRSTLIEVKILPASQSCGFDTWWHVAVSEVSTSEQVLEAHRSMCASAKLAR